MSQPRPFLRRGPSGPLATNFLGEIQVGYDQVVQTIFVPPSEIAFFPRNAAGDPIKVVLPGVEPGNYLEVDFRMNLRGGDPGSYQPDFDFAAIAVVTFDGSTPSIPSATTFYIQDSWTGSFFDAFIGEGPVPDHLSMSALCTVLIPDTATTATVELVYFTANGTVEVDIGSNVDTFNGTGVTLRVAEKGANAITQAGPGSLQASL